MTVINGIEIDNINYIQNEIKEAIINNDPIEDKLHVIIVISNPCQYARRYILAREFIKRFEQEQNVILYIVELIFDNQQFCVTENNNSKHLQLKTNTRALWHKENMINIGVQKLLPEKWKAFAWIDADIEFDSATWALDTLKILNGCRDIVQVFSHCSDMDKNEDPMRIFQGFGFQYTKKKKYNAPGLLNFWHPGFAYGLFPAPRDTCRGGAGGVIKGADALVCAKLSPISAGGGGGADGCCRRDQAPETAVAVTQGDHHRADDRGAGCNGR